MTGSSEVKEISLGDGFGTVAVKVNGVRVEVHADGSMDAYTDGAFIVHPVVQKNAIPSLPPARPKVGNAMPDGTVFAGISPVTHKPMYVTPEDAPLTYSFNQARDYAQELKVDGHNDWRVPTKAELKVLFKNAALIGGFNETGNAPEGWYCSSTRWGVVVWSQRFSDGTRDYFGRESRSSLRCVRG
jgi:hypothetical protein